MDDKKTYRLVEVDDEPEERGILGEMASMLGEAAGNVASLASGDDEVS
jgi:hypothetical protein